MEMKAERRVFEKPKRLVFNRLGEGHPRNDQICSFWLAGRCNRNPCRFLHLDSVHPESHPDPQPQPQPQPQRQPKRPHLASSSDDHCSNKLNYTWRNPNLPSSKIVTASSTEGLNLEGKIVHVIKKQNLRKGGVGSIADICQEAKKKLCQYWVTGNCVHGDNCRDLHSWFTGSGFSLLTKLEGHNKAVTGVSLPSGSDKLFSGSKDESLCVWDCNSGQCINTVKLGSEIGCLISEGPWIFVGLQNGVKACNIETQTELLLSGPNGLVHSMVVTDDMLFGGVQDGSILVWKSTPESNIPVVVATLKGHKLAVLCLVVGANWLYSGSKDETIRVWDVKTLQCLHVLKGHSGFVTAVLCWDSYLLSGSLDNTLKMWALTENGNLEVVLEVGEESGILALCGIHDAEANPILLCSRTDNTVCLYNLPSFTERGRIFAKGVVETVEIGCDGLFFTGDATGQLGVWKLLGQPSEGTENS